MFDEATEPTVNRDPTKLGRDKIALNPGHSKDFYDMGIFPDEYFTFDPKNGEVIGFVGSFSEITDQCNDYESTVSILDAMRQEFGNRITAISTFQQLVSLNDSGMKETLDLMRETIIPNFISIRNILNLFVEITTKDSFDQEKFRSENSEDEDSPHTYWRQHIDTLSKLFGVFEEKDIDISVISDALNTAIME